MSWTSGDFRAYPARCMRFHILAASSLEPIFLGVWAHESSAREEATLLRQFRFLVRSNPGVDFAADRLFSEFSFRTKFSFDHNGDALLHLSAKPVLSRLTTLNPDLADILAGECQ